VRDGVVVIVLTGSVLDPAGAWLVACGFDDAGLEVDVAAATADV
jgi:hypothetical protein